jgi:CRP-like cAMP-binding protein
MVELARTNHLLAGLPEPEADRLRGHLVRVRLALGRVVQPAHHLVRKLYFPLDCVISLLYLGDEGDATEVAVVGREGLTGLTAFLGGNSSPTHAVVQTPGYALALDARIVRENFDLNSILHRRLHLFALAQMTQIAQTAACIRHHTIEQQLTRWLLLSFDRTASDTLFMTHELIANMLGVRRVGITEAAIKLQEKGYIHYHRGNITLVDRAGLESTGCECYGVINAEYRRLLTFEE